MKTRFTLTALFLVCGLFTLLLVSWKPFADPVLPLYAAGVVVSPEDYQSLVGAYASTHSGQALGGMLSKADLQKLISSMPENDMFVNFRFCTDPDQRMTSLMLMGSKRWYQSSGKIVCLRNGGSAEAFCPTHCEFQESGAYSMLISFDQFEANAAAFQQANPTLTWGGNIDKSALEDLLATIPATQNGVGFMFCTAPTLNQTSVIFIAGTSGAGPLCIRNGVDAASFCPASCEYRD